MKRTALLFVVLLVAIVVAIGSNHPSKEGSRVNFHWKQLEKQAARSTSGSTSIQARSFLPPRSETKVEELRASMTKMIGAPQVATLDFEKVRVARTEGGGMLWLVPGRKIHCLTVGPDLGVSCVPTASARSSGIAVGLAKAPSPTMAPKWFRIAGMVPDGVRAVRALVGDRAIELPVKRNTFVYQARQPIQVEGLVRR